MVAGVLAIGVTVAGPPAPAAAAPPAAPPAAPVAVATWSPALTDGDPVRVRVSGGVARLVPVAPPPGGLAAAGAGGDAAQADGAPPGAPGLLTLPAQELDVPVDRVAATLDPPSAAADGAAVDVRGLRPDGAWTEWVPADPTDPADPADPGTAASATLPAPVTAVQARLVLTPPDPAPDPADTGGVAVRGLTLTALPAAPTIRAQTVRAAGHHRVFATREGLVGGVTANGHVIAPDDLFVALPSRRALSPRDTSDYSVKICAPTGRCAFAPVWDVGPWNTRDDYWNPPGQRQSWPDLPEGLPQAQAARGGYNGGKDQFGRTVLNPAGIDLADGLFSGALGLTDNAWVDVDYLWTGDSPLATVRVDGRVDLRAAPGPGAAVVGLVADRAAVPLQCVAGDWLRVGTGQFLPAAAVPRAGWPGGLPRCAPSGDAGRKPAP